MSRRGFLKWFDIGIVKNMFRIPFHNPAQRPCFRIGALDSEMASMIFFWHPVEIEPLWDLRAYECVGSSSKFFSSSIGKSRPLLSATAMASLASQVEFEVVLKNTFLEVRMREACYMLLYTCYKMMKNGCQGFWRRKWLFWLEPGWNSAAAFLPWTCEMVMPLF